MSGSIVTYSPGSKTFVPRGNDGKWAPKHPGIIETGRPGVVENKPQSPPGPTILKQTNRQ